MAGKQMLLCNAGQTQALSRAGGLCARAHRCLKLVRVTVLAWLAPWGSTSAASLMS